ncbi:hypothetical protein SISNIDRAFT_489549 [Sistotremastrum niveocremeum HHB9708]|uniref:Uncharacterized protein n=1 Tax=Sistotremastrum niveocremeum HHB9708 TaxID=1314777 RepID=A0A164PX63_9AGAM|nr:hypothetical protein SISNIDRAFT_489549 [Sistotremastrum niveocremeum HHB9708]
MDGTLIPLAGITDLPVLDFDGNLRHLLRDSAHTVPKFIARRHPSFVFTTKDGNIGAPLADWSSPDFALRLLAPSSDSPTRLHHQLIYFGLPGTDEPDQAIPPHVSNSHLLFEYVWRTVKSVFKTAHLVDPSSPHIRLFQPNPFVKGYVVDFRTLRLLGLENGAKDRWQPIFAVERHTIHFHSLNPNEVS